ncbi:pyridoxamine 5'-phosphate oxidase [Synechococcus sp. CS-602]|uniref:pyridoxamine 5'-phosphate oxidase n=1 Tax=Synechococcaceae TaxID=1890426 RepID=UPI0008FF42A9|nr:MULTISPECIES: pyridoxamine 5'-phosphate oxidase [Synechococcaceae]MCT4363311.1 pyridoxamine 5'-phosphate oxidase [Candidatus Regnicoccus frigidus MAG-AL1]APD47167.1 pyridoxamine 5'-phosphate oxidase [Synechococcus sp. SynAce01]MCT0201997.1 pyridoxamine 5'-phosphate oxidase [Synechococcus sp. CS-603]MCT0205038.1 pyridoxamine 5'-phosphate oxidase [Synechococcus sp. CS-602]MCT0246242.1 pyridoxamine 5'-phosphate oxidase [Synechococcus sp. CS-601]
MPPAAPIDPAQLRRDYRSAALRRADLAADPVTQFRRWFDQAVASELNEPNAMVLGSSDGCRPSARTVLLKAFDARGFVFFTHYESRKANEIAAHPEVSLLFPWYGLERQVAILGRAERISAAESLSYFLSRPFGSRLGAWVSQQSTVIGSRSILESQLEAMKRRFAGGEVPLPPAWGGLRVLPFEFEFWQGRQNRLHDRFRYRPAGDQAGSAAGADVAWCIERLAP